jgi:putative flavoprotein involved in K+ transport
MRERHDTVIVGGGQAGLAMSAVLQRHGREHVVMERARIGERWRSERWDSLRFQFPNWSLQLPGYSYAGDDPDGFAGYREVLATIEEYAAHIRAPVREHTEVVDLTEDDSDGGFVVSVANGAVHAQHVVLATGPFQRPRIPEVSRQVSAAVLQTDPTRYRCPEQLPEGAVLVVGSGGSGCQIATNSFMLAAGCTCRSVGTGAYPGGYGARTSIGGSTRWAASTSRSTASRLAVGHRRWW